jgi:glutaredoxin-related protein
MAQHRHLLEQPKIHPAVREKIAGYQRDLVDEVRAAVDKDDVVIVGMAQNPAPRRARRLLTKKNVPFTYLQYGSYLSLWRRRLALKMWTGWPTFPMIFVKGVLIGGADDLERLDASGELEKMLKAPRPTATAATTASAD